MRALPPRFIPLFIIMIAVGSFQLQASAIPQRSAERARLFDEWRKTLEAADGARSERQHTEAAAFYRSVIESAEASHPRHLLVARAIDGLADVHRMQQRWNEAAAGYARSAAMWADLLGADQPRRAVSLHHLGMAQMELEQLAAAEQSFGEARRIFALAFGADSGEALNTQRALERVQAYLSLDNAP